MGLKRVGCRDAGYNRRGAPNPAPWRPCAKSRTEGEISVSAAVARRCHKQKILNFYFVLFLK